MSVFSERHFLKSAEQSEITAYVLRHFNNFRKKVDVYLLLIEKFIFCAVGLENINSFRRYSVWCALKLRKRKIFVVFYSPLCDYKNAHLNGSALFLIARTPERIRWKSIQWNTKNLPFIKTTGMRPLSLAHLMWKV